MIEKGSQQIFRKEKLVEDRGERSHGGRRALAAPDTRNPQKWKVPKMDRGHCKQVT